MNNISIQEHQFALSVKHIKWYRKLMIKMFSGIINEVVHFVILIAYERLIIDSKEMHEILGIWNKLRNHK